MSGISTIRDVRDFLKAMHNMRASAEDLFPNVKAAVHVTSDLLKCIEVLSCEMCTKPLSQSEVIDKTEFYLHEDVHSDREPIELRLVFASFDQDGAKVYLSAEVT